MKKIISILLVVALTMSATVVNADFVFGAPQDLGLGKGAYISLSTDELELYFTSVRAGGLGNEDIWVSTRQSVYDPWGSPTNLQTINSSYREGFPCISRDGLTLYFGDFFYGPDRPGGLGGHDLWFSTRVSRNDSWGAPVNMGAPFNSSGMDISPTLSHDGLIFIFGSNRSGGRGGYDLWMCTRPSVQDAWDPPVNMGPSVNSGSRDYCGNLSPDGLVMLFESDRSGSYKSWVTIRRTVNDPWEPPFPLPEPMHSMEVGPVLADGSMYYAGGMMYYDRMSQVPIEPVCDLNNDLKIDSADMHLMVDHWGENYALCDIGPMPWGDGVVDVEDLKVLAEYLFGDMHSVAHFKLDEAKGNIANDSARNRDGTVHGNPTWQPAGGVVGGALQLDGFNDYIKTGFVLNPADGELSICAWAKGGAPGQVIISQMGAMNWLLTDSVEGNLKTELQGTGRSAKPLQSHTIITDGNWNRIGLVWDGSCRRLYVGGIMVAEDTQGGLGGSSGGLYIGCGKGMETGTYWSGLIDDVRIYNVALTTEEIAALVQ